MSVNSLSLFDFTLVRGFLKQIPAFQFPADGQRSAAARGAHIVGASEFPGGLFKA